MLSHLTLFRTPFLMGGMADMAEALGRSPAGNSEAMTNADRDGNSATTAAIEGMNAINSI